VDALLAFQQLAADRYVTNVTISQNRAGDRNRSLRVICGFADTPFAFGVADIPRNRRPWPAFESSNARGIPLPYGMPEETFRLLADGVTDGDAL
jgi:hypothetical protein